MLTFLGVFQGQVALTCDYPVWLILVGEQRRGAYQTKQKYHGIHYESSTRAMPLAHMRQYNKLGNHSQRNQGALSKHSPRNLVNTEPILNQAAEALPITNKDCKTFPNEWGMYTQNYGHYQLCIQQTPIYTQLVNLE